MREDWGNLLTRHWEREQDRSMSARGGLTWALPLASVLVLAGCSTPEDAAPADVVPDDIAAEGTLLVATDPSLPPAQFEVLRQLQGTGGGPLTGFEVELLEAVADNLGLDVEWVEVSFARVLELADEGEVDLASSAITVTDERSADRQFVSFFTTATQWAAKEPNSLGVTPNNACGAKVGVRAKTVQVLDLQERSAACQDACEDAIFIVQYNDPKALNNALLVGEVNAMLADSVVVQWAIRQSASVPSGGTIAPRTLTTVGEPYDQAPLGWAIGADRDGLAEGLLQGLTEAVEDGTYADILESWNVEEGAMDAASMRIIGG